MDASDDVMLFLLVYVLPVLTMLWVMERGDLREQREAYKPSNRTRFYP